jgi:hypothetical protein
VGIVIYGTKKKSVSPACPLIVVENKTVNWVQSGGWMKIRFFAQFLRTVLGYLFAGGVYSGKNQVKCREKPDKN